MLTKSIIALALLSVGCVQAVPIRYAYPGPAIDLNSNQVVRPIDTPSGKMDILPYPRKGDDVSIATKREPQMFLRPNSSGGRPNGGMQILPYIPGSGGGVATKREPQMLLRPNSNGGRPSRPPNGVVQSLPYIPGRGAGAATKREPLKFVNPDSNPGVRPPHPGDVHILPYPYLLGDDAGAATKRATFPYSLIGGNDGRPILPPREEMHIPRAHDYWPTTSASAERESQR